MDFPADDDIPGRDDIREASDILSDRESSREYLEANRDYLEKLYEGREVVAVTSEGETEIAAAYDPESDTAWRQTLEVVEEVYGEQGYMSAVARVI